MLLFEVMESYDEAYSLTADPSCHLKQAAATPDPCRMCDCVQPSIMRMTVDTSPKR